MSQVIRVALPGYDALTDTNPDHFALYTDETTDYVLIKEKLRGSVNLTNGSTSTILHNLGYVPFIIVFYERTSGVWKKLLGQDDTDESVSVTISTTSILIRNSSGGTRTFKYYIFYDQIV